MRKYLKFISLIIMLSYSVSSFSQKIKTSEDLLRYDSKIVLFNTKFIQANLEKNRNNLETALSLYYDCLKLKPSSSAVYYELAQILKSMNNISESEVYIKKAIKYNPENRVYKQFLEDMKD